MGFYRTKIDKYLKHIEPSEKQLQTTREHYMRILKSFIEGHLEDVKYSTKDEIFGFGFGISYEEAFERLMFAQKEYNYLATLSLDDFYHTLINVENYEWAKLIQREKGIVDEHAEKLDIYQSKTGLVGKAASLFHTDKKKIEKYSGLLDDAKHHLAHAQMTKEEFSSLPEEEKVAYIVGRCEVDGKIRFDIQDYDRYYKKEKETEKNNNAKNNGEKGEPVERDNI